MAGLCLSFWVSRNGVRENGFLLSDEDALVWPGATPGEHVIQSPLTAHPAEAPHRPQRAWLHCPPSGWTSQGGFEFILLWIFLPEVHVYTRNGLSRPGW